MRAFVRRHPLLSGGSGIIIALLLGWGAARAWHDPVADVDTAPVTLGDVEETVSALGKVQPRTYVDVGAQASGQLRRLAVQPGDHVEAGQLLAEIDPQVQAATVESDRAERDRLTATLVTAEAQARYAAAELDRQRQLSTDHATRADIFDQAVRDKATTAAQGTAVRAQIAQSVFEKD